jgi:hypothetical protein
MQMSGVVCCGSTGDDTRISALKTDEFADAVV